MFAPAWPFRCSAMLANSGGCATRFAHTVLAVFPELPARLDHAEGERNIATKKDLS